MLIEHLIICGPRVGEVNLEGAVLDRISAVAKILRVCNVMWP